MINGKDFKDPGAIFRPTPFWGLNEELEAGELKRQIRLFREQGYGGVYLHPRAGMETHYLSEEFFMALDACVEEADRLGILVWLYDEDWAPSGKAGDKVLRRDPDFAQRYIELTPDEPGGYSVRQFSDDNGSYRHVNVDVCDKQVIDCFIEITHERYYERYKRYFGNLMPAIFTDEPNFSLDIKNALPWTRDFGAKFREKYGYDLLEHVGELFAVSDGAAVSKVRYDYWELISALFAEAYSKNIYDWCDARGIAYTGHFWEHVFPSPRYQGSVMPHYEYMHYPGIDMLFVADDDNPEQYKNDFIVKEASSVANQLGKERVLSEANGASGWGLDFAYQKRVLDWQLALGVNLFTLHLSLYSMIGYRKRDFPMSYLDHQPWWEDLRLINDYLGRMSYALSQGRYSADVLVLHPSSSTWGADADAAPLLGNSAKRLVRSLDQLRIMYDLGDDIIISRHAKIADGKLQVGNMNYKIVVLPETYILRNETFILLREFSEQGGTIVSCGKTPYLLDGEPSDELIRFFADENIIINIENEITALSDFFNAASVERIALHEAGGKDISHVYGHVRVDANDPSDRLLFLCNTDMEDPRELIMPMDRPFEIVRYDGMTGEASTCEVFTEQGGGYFIKFTLNALESVLFSVNKKAFAQASDEKSLPDGKSPPCREKTIRLHGWTIETKDWNAINLQFCRASLDGKPFCELGDVLRVDETLKDAIGMEHGTIFTREPWMYSEAERNEKHSVAAEYPFHIGEMPGGAVMAAVELPDKFRVYVNGSETRPTGGHYKDRAFALYDIKSRLHEGENVLRIETCEYGVLINLESVYIVGDFRLTKRNGGFSISPPLPLLTGNIVEQGYPYYSGRIEYRAEAEIDEDYDEAYLTFGKFMGVTATIKLNGDIIHKSGWPPCRADLTGRMAKGKNTFAIEIANSLQNLLGPFGAKANQKIVHQGCFYADRHEVFFPAGFDGDAAIHLHKKA